MLAAQTNAPSAATQEWQTVLDAMRAENDNQRAATGRLQEILAATRAENELLRQQWAAAQLRAQRLGGNPNDGEARRANQELAESLRRLQLAETELQQLLRQLHVLINALKEGGDVAAAVRAGEQLLGEFDAGGSAPSPTRRLAAATVVDVNRELRAVVLNVGERQGARVGMPFLVTRGERVVAAVRVVEVRPQVCGALIEQVEKGVTVRAGDGAQVTQTTGAGMREARPASEKEILWKSKR